MSFSPNLLAAVPSAGQAIDWWPLVVLLISLAAIVLLITRLRLHAFMALIAAAMLTGVLSDRKLPGEYGTLPNAPHKEKSHWVRAVDLTVEGFGGMAAKMGVVVALAAVIGVCLVESGAADKVVRRFLALLGEKRSGHAMFGSGYVLSIPIFFETYFMLLMPLAQSLHVRTGRSYMMYVLAICCGGTITHSLVAPHPGPVTMAAELHLDLGQTIVAGILAGILPAICMWWLAQRIARRVNAPMRDTATGNRAELEAIVATPESALPSLAASLTPILLPLVLIGAASIASVVGAHDRLGGVSPWLQFLGDRHVALMIGAACAMGLLMTHKKLRMAQVTELIGGPFATAGVIILVSSAGGAFGAMLRHAGVGDMVAGVAGRWDVNLIFLAWAVSSFIRVAQGSATVAMATTSAILYPIVSSAPLPYSPLYIFLAIGFGSKMISWMNDSGFWTVSKVSGFTESETLKSWTVLVTTGSIVGLVQCLILSKILPLAP